MTSAETILARIREALTVAAPRPSSAELHSAVSPISNRQGAEPPRSLAARRWLPAVGSTFEDHVEQFRKNAIELKADFRMVANLDELKQQLREVRDAEGWKKVAAHDGELVRVASGALDRPICRTDQPYEVHELEQCDVGITECDALVAQTGSVLVTARSAGGRAASVLPPHHVAVARREQLVADLPAAFELLKRKYADNYPSFIGFITGPSRTGDIERILVLGAHGPKKLTIFCVG